jgi:F-type H+-transporting ATPase subunit b
MGIDWFTFFAQIFNFLILVWLLKKFLYQPVLAAMAKRQEGIAARLEEARTKAMESEAEKQRYQEMQDELKARIAGEMHKAKADAETFREGLMAAARQEVDTQRLSWLTTLRKEEASFLAETSHSITDYFQVLSRNALSELAGEDLGQRIVEVFLDKLASHDQDAITELSKHISGANEPLTITTAFALTEAEQARVVERLEAIVGTAQRYEFEVEKTLLAGISIEVDGKKIHWDLGEYLKKFEKRLADFLENHPAMSHGQ